MSASAARPPRRGLLIALVTVLLTAGSVAAATGSPGALGTTALRTESAVQPLGIDAKAPRLSWQLTATRRATTQTAYRVLVASTPEALKAGAADVWDTGRVESSRSVEVPYAGPALQSATRYWWTVQVWDDLGAASGWADPTWFETGLLQPSDWTAGWVGPAPKNAVTRDAGAAARTNGLAHDAGFYAQLLPRGGTYSTEAGTDQPVPYLRTTFDVAKPVASARLYSTALGVYDMHLNGSRVTEDALNPGWTDYRKHVMYQTYDVTERLKQGRNALGGLLGLGWYAGHVAFSGPYRYGETPALLAQLDIRYADGTRQRVATDGSWRLGTGGMQTSDLLMGEAYDARREQVGWDTPTFNDAAWLPVAVAGPAHEAGPKLVAQVGPTVQAVRELPAIKRTSPAAGTYIFDLGQNIAGVVRLKVTGAAGTTVTLRHGEEVNPNGTLYTANLRAAKATDTYVLRGSGEEVYQPRFTFHGFRYVEVTGYPGVPPLSAVTAIALASATPDTGTWSSSDPQLNQLQSNIQWGQRGNFLSVPTDCPQRDERAGWTGDAQVFARTAMFNADTAGFYTKWLRDLNADRGADGSYPDLTPFVNGTGNHATAGWADAAVIVPWNMFLVYGDRSVIDEHWTGMVGWIEYLRARAPGLIRPAAGYGDWLNLGDHTPTDQVATAYFAYSTRLVAKMAAATGRTAEAAKYHTLADQIRSAYQAKYVSSTGRIVGDTQTAYVLALSMDLLPASLRKPAADHLVNAVKRRGWHLSTGFLGTRDLLPVLTETGHADVAYRLLNQRDYPSWRFMIERGATTMWERWDSIRADGSFNDPSMTSFNHYAYGAVGEWLYRSVAGLDADPAQPGYRRLVIKPVPGGGLTRAEATFDSVYGPVRSAWRISGGDFHLDVTVAPNTTAEIRIPADQSVREDGQELVGNGTDGLRFVRLEDGTAVFEAGSGTYRLVSDAGDRFTPGGGGAEPDPEPTPTPTLPPQTTTYDYVDVGEPVSELQHNIAYSTSSGTNTEAGRTRRYTGQGVKGGYFEFDMKIETGKPFLLRTVETYDATGAHRDYDVLVNGVKVFTRDYIRSSGNPGLDTYVVRVTDPALVAGSTVRIRYQEDAEGRNFEPSVADTWTEPLPK